MPPSSHPGGSCENRRRLPLHGSESFFFTCSSRLDAQGSANRLPTRRRSIRHPVRGPGKRPQPLPETWDVLGLPVAHGVEDQLLIFPEKSPAVHSPRPPLLGIEPGIGWRRRYQNVDARAFEHSSEKQPCPACMEIGCDDNQAL